MGVAGACRGIELCRLLFQDVVDYGDTLFVNIKNTKNHTDRSFAIKNSSDTGTEVVAICKKYMSLRPATIKTDRFFISYRNGMCFSQPVGKNSFGSFPQKIAKFLNLPNANLYTGHCFRRTSASLLADSGANVDQLKRHGGWKSGTVAEGYVERSISNKKHISDQIFKQCSETIVNEDALIKKSQLEKNSQATQEIFGTSSRSIFQNKELSDSLVNFAHCSGVNINITVNNNYCNK